MRIHLTIISLSDRLNRISAKVNLARKTQFIPMLVSYWKLKRQSRNGVPLIRRLQASSHGQRVNMYKVRMYIGMYIRTYVL